MFVSEEEEEELYNEAAFILAIKHIVKHADRNAALTDTLSVSVPYSGSHGPIRSEPETAEEVEVHAALPGQGFGQVMGSMGASKHVSHLLLRINHLLRVHCRCAQLQHAAG